MYNLSEIQNYNELSKEFVFKHRNNKNFRWNVLNHRNFEKDELLNFIYGVKSKFRYKELKFISFQPLYDEFIIKNIENLPICHLKNNKYLSEKMKIYLNNINQEHFYPESVRLL